MVKKCTFNIATQHFQRQIHLAAVNLYFYPFSSSRQVVNMPAATCRRLQVIEFARQKAVGDVQSKKGKLWTSKGV